MSNSSGWRTCFESQVEFKLVLEPQLTFEDAEAACQTEGATLARVSNPVDFQCVLGITDEFVIPISLEMISVRSSDFYLGMFSAGLFDTFMSSVYLLHRDKRLWSRPC